MKYKVMVKKQFAQHVVVEVDVPPMGTDEEAVFQMEERAIELAEAKADDLPIEEWDHVCCYDRDAYILTEGEES